MKSSITKPFYWLLGWLSAGLGLLGVFVPLLPTTVFFIFSVWCWARSHPQLAEKILRHPRYGQGVRDFIERGQISAKGKCFAIAGMSLGFLLFIVTSKPAFNWALGIALVLMLVATWLLTRPSPTKSIP